MATADWEASIDEVQALAAIYGPDFQVTAASGVDTRSTDAAALIEAAAPAGDWWVDAELAVQVALPSDDGLPILLEQPATAGGRADAGGNDLGEERGAEPAFRVAYLPPIMLRLRLGAEYPSTRPPVFSLTALWLSRGQAADLEGQLRVLWEEQGPGLPVIYTWATWLQTSALQHIGGAEALTLRSAPACGGGGAGGGEENVDAECPADAMLLSLVRYSAARELQAFQAASHTCGICFEEQLGSRFVRLDPCGHAYCRSCLCEQARVHVAEGSLGALNCPDPECKQPLAAHTLRQVLPPDGFERWEALTLQHALDAMPDAAYCPRCSTLSLEDPGDNCAECTRCFFVFCSLCSEGRHPGVCCVSAETRLAMLRRKAEGGGAAAVAALRRREQEFMSLAEIERTSKPCPSCGAAIQRSEGCNKMACSNCGAFWCWKCGKQISGYEHFRAGGTCILFDEAEVLRWEARWEDEVQRHAAAQYRNEYLGEFWGMLAGGGGAGEGEPLPAVACPQCGQRNFKFQANNHLCCWSCTRHFCALCRTVLQRRGGAHFGNGPGKCKQHT